MNFCSTSISKFGSLFILAICTLVSMNSCEIEDGDTELNILNSSDYYLKINIGGNVIDVNHGINYQVKPDLSYEQGCEILFNNCPPDEQKAYLASSFGPNSQNQLNLAFTNLNLDKIDLEQPDLLSLANSLPSDENNSLLFSNGTLEEGITSGNLFIGTEDYKYTYIHEQKSWARFMITEVTNDTLNKTPVVCIRFEIDCILFDETNNEEIIVRNGEGFLPFQLHVFN